VADVTPVTHVPDVDAAELATWRRAARSADGVLLDEAGLGALAAAEAGVLPPHALVALEGEMGAGKTTFVRAAVRGLGAAVGAASPTYALVHRYETANGPVFHIDAWRLEHPDEARDLDLDDLLREGRAVLVEWPDRLAGWLPTAALRVQLAHVADPALRRVQLA
jgi:tRNA threonylcarbamoyladenosine biosynthesis protein TsaE